MVFCNTKRDCQDVCDALSAKGISALALNGDLEQRDRDRVLVRFSNGSCRVLVATDVAARGLDIKDLGLVINYELSFDPEVHIHRVGVWPLQAPAVGRQFSTPQERVVFTHWKLHPSDLCLAAGCAGVGATPVALDLSATCASTVAVKPNSAGDILGALR